MLPFRKTLTLLIGLSVLVSAVRSHAAEEVEDLIDVFESNDRIVGVIEGRRTISVDLRPKETVLWSGSKGHLGAYLTSDRFLAISTSSRAWQELPLRSGESGKAVGSISSHIALVVTEDRAVGFDAASNRFIETRFPIRDELVAAEAEEHVAVVVTSSRAFGLAAETSAFTEIRLRVGETIEAIKITASKATVRTSDRLLTFEATGATWSEYRL